MWVLVLFMTWFCRIGYPQKDTQLERVSKKSLDALYERPDRKKTGVPLVLA